MLTFVMEKSGKMAVFATFISSGLPCCKAESLSLLYVYVYICSAGVQHSSNMQ